ncbi:hypothetical protein [Mycolicibacterium hippocampi]|uniref:Uncharacterized protein n=1 Tax=Mycolicibacterium hippocampi TaxID=659824 RepID=A0A850PUY2_9MYCO|nr:hypothetical protein [Mycolicibacterium hippocampi]NVN52727.1 hypothetical protein [Mycolicibacterium hippocampi]
MESGDLEPRVEALENQVRDLSGRVRRTEQDAAAARVLAGAADRDVGELRGEIRDFRSATTAGFNAMRQDFVDLREHVDRGFTEMRGRFDGTAAGLEQVAQLLDAVLKDRHNDK